MVISTHNLQSIPVSLNLQMTKMKSPILLLNSVCFQVFEVKQAVYEFVRVGALGRGGGSPLHLACARDSSSVRWWCWWCWYIYYDEVSVCLCVTKNHHLLKLSMCNDVQWCVMMCDNVRWCVMMCDNMQWCVMMCDDVWCWCAIMCYQQFPIRAERRRRKVRRW